MNKSGQNIETMYSLSPMQEGMLFHALYAPQANLYFHQFIYTFEGRLNPTAFKQAWQRVVEHYAVLRTLFVWEKGKKPLQVVRKQVTLPWFEKDWRELSPSEQKQALEQLVTQDRIEGFSLKHPPLLRCHLIQTAYQGYQFVLSFHHLIIDGWSLSLILKDVFTLYQAFCRGQALHLSPTRSFRDYIYWIQEQDSWQAKHFWQARLQGVTAPTPLPILGTVTPTKDEFMGDQLRIKVVPDTIVEALQTFARQHHLTMNTLVQGAWALLLGRYSREAEVIFGVTSAGRPVNLVGAEKIVGLFINTLPMRISLDSKQQLIPWLQQIQTYQVEQEAYSYSALVDIHKWSQIPSHLPLFETLVVFENYPMDKSLFDFEGGFKISDFHAIDKINYPLVLVILPRPQFTLRILYDGDCFKAVSIDRMLGHLQTLLAAYLTEPSPILCQLPLLTQEEHQQLIRWNRTDTDYRQNQTLPQLIQAQVARTPTAIAVTFENQSLTYQQLNDYAHYLAVTLQQQHAIGPDQLVGIMLERSLEMVVGLLGILTAGGAYLPLDPSYPKSRIQFMLKDAQVPVLLTQTSLLDQLILEQKTVVMTINLAEYEERGRTSFSSTGEANQTYQEQLQPHHLAYVIYTSGSTGQPKGVMNTHLAIVNRLLWMQDTYQLTPADCVLQKTPFSFDVSVWEFFWPLLVGARLVVAKPEGHKDSEYLIELIKKQQITTLHFVPSMLQVFLQQIAQISNSATTIKSKPIVLGNLRQVICSGEALPIELQKQFFSLLDAKLHNLYGPTEAAVDVTYWECQPDTQLTTVPIGRPIANIQIYLLDQCYHPVPIGVPGELYIGGIGLARGYLNRPELTAEKFIANPLLNYPAYQHLELSSRLYKTGDLARYLPDDTSLQSTHLEACKIEYLGRLDFQVKIHGLRIELGEIEAALMQQPTIETAVVIQDNHSLSEQPETEQRLIAYLVLALTPTEQTDQIETMGSTKDQPTVSQWQQLYDEIYRQTQLDDPTFNITGWNDSYSGRPIPVPAMREWVEATVARVLSYQPKRVLEIGCGTGLLLFRIAPFCQFYHGTDISAEALRYLEQHLPALNLSTPIQLTQQSADDFSGIDSASFDTVILNSVVQCFPNIDYLFKVIQQAIKITAPGGIIFLGDIRSLPLLEVFHASVQLYQASDYLPRQQLQQRIQQHVDQDKELVVDPRFFLALKQHFSSISTVQIQLKRGVHDNELTHFRYDATLICQSSIVEEAENSKVKFDLKTKISTLDCQAAALKFSEIRQYLLENAPSIVIVKNIANARLVKSINLLKLLTIEENNTVKKLRQALTYTSPGIDPTSLWQLAEELSYQLYLTPAIEQPEHCHAIFYQPDQTLNSNFISEIKIEPVLLKSWRTYAKNPQPEQLAVNTETISKIRAALKNILPDYMLPARFVILDALPLTSNGKIDRNALPAPETRRQLETPWIKPCTPTEMQLVKIWQEVLNVEQVGIRDNFFDLGGHSLQAIRLMAKIQQSFGISLPLSVIFHGATIEQLAHQLHESSPKVWAPLVTIQPDGTHQPFYCVPGAGGNVIYLYELAHLLGNDFPFYGLQSIGLDGKSKPHHRIESMAACYVKQIQQVQPQGPYCLGGHSFGGWVAFEMAQQLQRQGQQISRLVIFDTFLPTTHALNIGHSMTADWNDAQWLVILAEVLEKLIGKSLSISLEIIQPLQPDEQLQYLLERLQQINWLPLETDMRQLRGLVEVYKASTQATYEMPPSVYPTPITLFRAQIPLWKQTKLPTELVEIMQEPTFGWQQVAQGEVEIHEIPGDHITIMTAPSIQILAEKLKRCIASISHKPISH